MIWACLAQCASLLISGPFSLQLIRQPPGQRMDPFTALGHCHSAAASSVRKSAGAADEAASSCSNQAPECRSVAGCKTGRVYSVNQLLVGLCRNVQAV